jgi:hypothetical protein
MTKESTVEAFLEATSGQVNSMARAAHEIFVMFDCSTYVKTIYIGYDIGGVMVGALYPREDHIEVALALSENDPNPLLIDASHLTWRTLPVAALLTNLNQIPQLELLISSAVDRLKHHQHEVYRDNAYFARKSPQTTGRPGTKTSEKDA